MASLKKMLLRGKQVDLSVCLCGYLGFLVTLGKLNFAYVTWERGLEAWEWCKQSLFRDQAGLIELGMKSTFPK